MDFVKRDLNIVFSIGKTASTSIFKSWASIPSCVPVVHTHGLDWFCVVDREDSIFTQNMLTNYRQIVYGIMKPDYLPFGYIEFRFQIGGSVSFGDVFPNVLFKQVNVIGITRDPVHRRISQFLNTVTIESFNAGVDSMMNDSHHVVPGTSVELISQMKTFKSIFQAPGVCEISKKIVDAASDENRLLNKVDLLSMFKRMFTGVDYVKEYTWFFNRISSHLNVQMDLDKIKTNGFHIETGHMDYSNINQRDSDDLPVKCLVFKMEDMKKDSILKEIKEFTGIVSLTHSRAIAKEVPIVDLDLGEMKDLLRLSFNPLSLYKNGFSEELSTVKRLGY